MFTFSVLIVIICVMCDICIKVYGGTEAQMRALLFAKLNNTDYSPRVRPIKDTGNTMNLTVDMYLVSINLVEEVEQKITTTAYLKIVWSDTFMTWEPTEYGNITEFSLPQDEIWKPDIALANAYDSISGLGDRFMYLTVTHVGKITWEPFQRFASTCSLEMKYFPFDTHVCDIQMATWSSTKQMINIVPGNDGFNIDSYEENANWNLLNVSTFDSSTSATSGLSFSIRIRRKPVFYVMNTIIPILLLSILNNFVFVLPCNSGEKLSYAIVLFLSFAIFLLIVTEVMPEGMSSIPVITIYLLLEIVFSTLIVLVSIVQLRLHNRENKSQLPQLFENYTKAIQQIKKQVCCHLKITADDNENGNDMFQVKTPVSSIEETIFDTKLTKKNMGQRQRSNDNECYILFKRKLFCGANKVDTADENVLPDTWRNRFNHMSEKTSFKLADILGISNKVEPDTYFNKPTQVTPLYDQNLDVEELDDDNDTLTSETLYEALQGANTVKRFAHIVPSSSDSETSSDISRTQEKKNDITWPDFVLALDNTLFVVSVIMNTITTVTTFFVSMAN